MGGARGELEQAGILALDGGEDEGEQGRRRGGGEE